MVESDSGSSSDEEAFMSAAEELSSSPSPHHYETPESDGNDYESAEGRGDVRTDCDTIITNYEEQVDTVEVPMTVDNYTDKYSYTQLHTLDRDFFSSPRLIVRGIWRGEGLEFQAKRKTEGRWVEWILNIMKTRNENERTILSVKAHMSYKYGLGPSSATERYGYNLEGGWAWSGAGYGFLPPPSPLIDTTEEHVDLEEAIFWEDANVHHFSGSNCSKGAICREDGCGERIWGLILKSFTTVVNNPDAWHLPYAMNIRKDQEKDKLFLSVFAFYNGEQKLVIQRDPSSGKGAWLTRVNERFDDKADIDENKLEQHKIISGTRAPKNNNLPEEDDDDDPAIANLDYLIQELDGDSENNQEAERNRESNVGGSSWQNNFNGCEICDYKGFIAFHLRHSNGCVRQLRSKPGFLSIKGTDECFIIKFALLAGECPSSTCPTGRHTALPEECLEWWIIEGWLTLGWRGAREDADATVIDSKIKNFLSKHKSKSRHQQLLESQPAITHSQPSAADNTSERFNENNKCGSCNQVVDLISHFHEAEECLKVYVRHHLPKDFCGGMMDAINMRKSIFHLSIIIGICARVQCPARNSFRYIAQHLNRNEDCLDFYRNEGVLIVLPNWREDASAHIVGRKIAGIKRSLYEKKVKERTRGYLSFQKELSGLLERACSGCGAMSPDAEDVASTMTTCGRDDFDNQLWMCPSCVMSSNNLEEIRRRTSERLQNMTERLKKTENREENDFSLLRISPSKAVLAPTLIHDSDGLPFVAPDFSTVILVPQQPPALETLLGLSNSALEQRTELNEYVQDVLRSPIFTDFGDTFFCLYRSLLGNIRHKMNKILRGISSVARGEVVSLNPNVTTAVKRNPNLRMTLAGALQEECCWSLPYQEHRSMESKTRSQFNGRAKIFICGTIVDDLKDCELRRVLLVGCKAFVNPSVTAFEEIEGNPATESFITKMAPIILKYIHAKAKLFVKHIIAPHYSSYDLKLRFHTDKLRVQIEGYLWPKQFDMINQSMAEYPETSILPDVVDEVTENKGSLPTATLCWREISETYEIEEIRAKNIVEVAKQYQVDGDICPLSLINIWTPGEWSPSDGEQSLRARALELSHQRAADENVEEAIVDIASILMEEGLSEELISEHINIDILRSLKLKLIEKCPQRPVGTMNALMWYHILLLKTGGRNQWTVKRNCGETQVVPYLPLLLEALQEKMNVRIALTEEYLTVDTREHGSHSERLMAGFDWTEVSTLEFLHGLSIANFEEQVSETTVAIMTNQEEEQSFRESTEKDEEVDDVFVNSKDERYIIINGDIRKLYSKRPPAVESMTLAQFTTQYYKKRREQNAVIDPNTNIGQESNDPIVGGETRAPTFMKLRNQIIMKKRSARSQPIPLLLPLNTLDDYGQHLLFQPWRTAADLLEENTEEDKLQQKQNRLALFPRSIFP